MMTSTYMPYGAYELKARYQWHLLLAMLITVTMVAITLLGGVIANNLTEEPMVRVEPAEKVRTVILSDIKQQPLIKRSTEAIKEIVPLAKRLGTNPVVVDDDQADELNGMLVSNVEKEYMVNAGGLGDVPENAVFIIETEDAIPPPTEYERVDLPAEMIYSYTPPYPKFARLAGLEGLVWVQAYVDREGNVRVAQVGKSSGSDLLDEAAVAAAYKNKFKPAIRDGEPVAIWVTYQVRFKLE